MTDEHWQWLWKTLSGRERTELTAAAETSPRPRVSNCPPRFAEWIVEHQQVEEWQLQVPPCG